MSEFKVGDLVECVDDRNNPRLVRGNIYEVEEPGIGVIVLKNIPGYAQSRRFRLVDRPIDRGNAQGDIGPQRAAPSSPGRVEAQARDARRLLGTPPDAPATSNKIEVIVGRFEFEFTSFEQWVNKATSWFKNARLRGDQAICVDAAGRVCLTGREFMRARDEGTFPIKVYRATL